MKKMPNPQLPVEDWDQYIVYVQVQYDPREWNSRHWVCPGCSTHNSIMHHRCGGCFREKVKKTIGHNRKGNPVERWVMRV